MNDMRQALLISILLLLGFWSKAQNEDQTSLEFDAGELVAPAFPAATIMGVQPMEIVKPGSFNELQTAILSNFMEGQAALIPNDLAIEVMPAWLKPESRRYVTAGSMAKNKVSLWDNLAISIASVNENIGDSSFNSNLGFGLRTRILNGRLSKANVLKAESLKQRIRQNLNLPNAVLTATLKMLMIQPTGDADAWKTAFVDEVAEIVLARDSTVNETALRGRIAELWETANKTKAFVGESSWNEFSKVLEEVADKATNDPVVTDLAVELAELKLKRVGWIWELAAAGYLNFPTGEFDFSQGQKIGVWSTLTWTCESSKWDVSAMVRYMNDMGYAKMFDDVQSSSDLDYGGRVSFNTTNFTFAGEFLGRSQARKVMTDETIHGTSSDTFWKTDYRAAVTASYRIPSKNMVISYTFGKNFDQTEGVDQNLVNQLSLNFGFGSVPVRL